MATKKAVTSKKSTSKKPKTKSVAASAAVGKKSSLAKRYDSFCGSVKKNPLVVVALAEFIGAFLLTVAFIEMQSSPLFFAFALAGVVFIVGGVSGAHVNPAMTIGAWVTGKVKAIQAIVYMASQFLGAGAAWLVLDAFLKNSASETALMTTSLFHAAAIPEGKEWYLFFAELLGATILALGIAVAMRHKHNKTASALTAGFTVLIALYVSMSLSTVLLSESYTGFTFLNPAIAFAANALAWNWWSIAIFVIAPVIGGVIGFVLRDLLYSKNDDCLCETCK
jgi:glycerol uptake facilitator-like aquaporin